MRKILVIAERLDARLDDGTWELLGAARALADGGEVIAALVGHDVAALADELAKGFDAVHVFDAERLVVPDGEAWREVLAPWIRAQAPFATLALHTNAAIDLVPGLAIAAGVPLLSDCIALEATEAGLVGTRSLYGGKIQGRFRADGEDAGVLATVRGGAFGAAPATGGAGVVVAGEVPEAGASRRRLQETVAREAGDVDITQADVLVGVGRGIEEEENLEIVRSLAAALGGELAGSRPVVDKGWLPKSRQVGTSGVTVKPKLYVAVGISGSFQHVGGIKGSPYLVAINKDPRAPIFGVADVGIVGDLFDVVPLLEEKVREAKG